MSNSEHAWKKSSLIWSRNIEIEYTEEPSGNFKTEHYNEQNLQNSVNGLNSRIEGTEERISRPEDRTIKIRHSEQQKEINWKKKNEQSLRDLWL